MTNRTTRFPTAQREAPTGREALAGHRRRRNRRHASRTRHTAAVVWAATVALAATAVYAALPSGSGHDAAAPQRGAGAPSAAGDRASASPSPSAGPTTATPPSPWAPATTSAAPRVSASHTARATAPSRKRTAVSRPVRTGGTGPGGTAPTSAAGDLARFTREVTDLTNAERAKAGCGPLTVDSRAQKAAQVHSDDMVTRHYFDHPDPEGHHADYRLRAQGYSFSSWGENIAYGQPTPANVMHDWMNSPPHRENILNCLLQGDRRRRQLRFRRTLVGPRSSPRPRSRTRAVVPSPPRSATGAADRRGRNVTAFCDGV